MSLDNIQLSTQTCEILFSHNLIGDQASKPKAQTQEKIKIECLGENKNQVVFIVNDPSSKFLADEEMEMLTKLVSACKMTVKDIALVNFTQNTFNYQEVNEQFKPEKVLLFGVANGQIGLPFEMPYFQIQNYSGQFYLSAPSLKELLNDKKLKAELWTALQNLFLK
ncbi:MAG: hypothetical protein ACTHJN_04715 [Ginsengibacter sp.]